MNPFPIIRRKRKVKPRQRKRRLDNFMKALQEGLIQVMAHQSKNNDHEDATSMRDEEETDADDEAGFSSDEDDFGEDDRPRLDVQNLPSSSEQDNAADVDGHINGEVDSLANEEDPVETEAEYYTDSSYASPLETSSDEDEFFRSKQHEVEFTQEELDKLLAADTSVDGPTELRNFLADCFTRKGIVRDTGNYMLKGLKALKNQKNVFDGLPRDIRTLLKTPRKVIVEPMAEGTYYHFGMLKGIISYLSVSTGPSDSLQVMINMDGLPLFKSSCTTFWPILGLIKGEATPFPIGVWAGNGKPTCANTYLRKFVEEYKKLKRDGVFYNGRLYTVSICGVTCDAPARAFVTGTRGHASRNACPRCKTNGIFNRCFKSI